MGDGLAFVATTNLLSNTGVLSLQGDTGALSLSAGSGIGISGLTISNTGVLSLQGDTGALSFTAGTGIGISGLTFTNTGIISASAGSGISVSGTNPLTIENTGVLSLQGDTGALSLGAGSGIGISGLTISNTGVLGVGGSTTSYLTGNIEFKSGSGISIAQSTTAITVGNTGVLSLQGDTGALSLGAGTGIGISGLTISNTGVTSLGAGSGISVSGSTGGVTVGNTGVLSLQGDTGALSFTAGTGIGISGLTFTNTGIISASAGNGISVSGTNPLDINMSGSYSGNFSVTGNIVAGYGLTGNSNAPNGSQFVGFYENEILGDGNWAGFWRDNGNYFGVFLGEQNKEFNLGFANYDASAYAGLNANSGTIALVVTPDGAVYTGYNQNFAVPSASGASYGINVRNTLDDGSGNMSIAGTLTAQYINANVNNDNPNGATPTVVLSIYGGNEGGALSDGQYGLGISNGTLDFLTPSGENFAWWANTSQIASMNGSGDFSVNGSISTGAMPSFSNGIRETGYGSLRVGGYFAGIEMWQGSGHDNVRAFNAENYNAWSVGFFNESSGAFDGINSGDYSIAFAVYPNGEVVTGNAQSQGVNSNNFISVRNTLDDGSGNMSIAGYLIAHPTMGSNVVSGTLWNLSPTSSNVTFGSSNTGTVTLYIETIRATTTGKYYVQTHNTTANNYPDFWATYLEANVTYYVGQTFVIEIPGGDTITNWYAGGNAGGTLVVTGILNLG